MLFVISMSKRKFYQQVAYRIRRKLMKCLLLHNFLRDSSSQQKTQKSRISCYLRKLIILVSRRIFQDGERVFALPKIKHQCSSFDTYKLPDFLIISRIVAPTSWLLVQHLMRSIPDWWGATNSCLEPSGNFGNLRCYLEEILHRLHT